jgi:hypothetical protein
MGSPAPVGGRSPVSVSPGPMGQSPGPASSSSNRPPGLGLPIGAGDQRRSSLPSNSPRVSTSGKPPSASGARSPSASTTPRTPRFLAQHLVMDRDSPKSGGGPGMASPRATGPLMLNESVRVPPIDHRADTTSICFLRAAPLLLRLAPDRHACVSLAGRRRLRKVSLASACEWTFRLLLTMSSPTTCLHRMARQSQRCVETDTVSSSRHDHGSF